MVHWTFSLCSLRSHSDQDILEIGKLEKLNEGQLTKG